MLSYLDHDHLVTVRGVISDSYYDIAGTRHKLQYVRFYFSTLKLKMFKLKMPDFDFNFKQNISLDTKLTELKVQSDHKNVDS